MDNFLRLIDHVKTWPPALIIGACLFLGLSVIGLGGAIGMGCHAISGCEQARYKYRAESNKAFWERNKKNDQD